MRYIHLLLCSLLFTAIPAIAKTSYACPTQLSPLANSSIHSIYQDGLGAIWMNTNYGLSRFNGSCLDFFTGPLPSLPICGNGGNLFYVQSNDGILKFDIRHLVPQCLHGRGIDYPNCSMVAENEDLWIADRNRIFSTQQDSLVLYCSLPNYVDDITALCMSDYGSLIAATSSSGIWEIKEGRACCIVALNDNICTLYKAENGDICVGLTKYGVRRYNHSWDIVQSFDIPITECRTFCEDAEGNLYIGSIDGLFVLNPDGQYRLERSYTPPGHSICSLLRDKDDNIWIGTFYNGAFICETDNSPFHTVNTPPDIELRLINEMVEDCRQDIWIVTDHYGMYRHKTGTDKFHLIPGTENRKFKSAYYDRHSDVLWIGEHLGNLSRYDITSNSWSSYEFGVSIYDIKEHNGKLFLASSNGVYYFTPGADRNISHKIAGYDGIANALAFDGAGRLWIAGIGLFCYDEPNGLTSISELGGHNCNGILCENDGSMLVASTGYGIYYIKDNEIRTYTNENIGLADNYVYFIDHLTDSLFVVGTRSGLSVIKPEEDKCYNYCTTNGLGLSSAREGCVLKRNDGSMWIGGTDGIVSISPKNILLPTLSADLVFDKLTIENKSACFQESEMPFLNEIVLPRGENNFSVKVASFNFTKIIPESPEYRLLGQNEKWSPFQLQNSISFMNIRPGRYSLQARVGTRAISIPVTVRANWYASKVAMLVYILITLALLIWLLSSIYSKMLLSQQLSDQKKQNDDRMRFFINMSHELRTPLTLMIGQLELFFRKNPKGVTGMKHIESSHRNAIKMQQIVSDLLDFEKQGQGYSTISVEHQDLCSVVGSTRNEFAQYADYRKISLTCDLPSMAIPVWIDVNQIHRVLANILINAFKFTADGGTINISVRQRKSHLDNTSGVEIIIADSGSGIPEKSLDRIFDPFYQDPYSNTPDRRNQGTGIGLAVSKGIIELHHGSISASNGKSGGAVFNIILPMGQDWFKNDPNVTEGRIEHAVSIQNTQNPYDFIIPESSRSTSGYKMLIIEDDDDMRTMLHSIFMNSYKIIEAKNGSEGFEKAKAEQPDIIISDVMMPVMGGISLCSQLRSDFETCHIPIILLTAHSSSKNVIDGIETGADDYITKPFNIELLEARCRNLLETRHVMRSKFGKAITEIESLTKNKKDEDFLESAISTVERFLTSSNLGVPLLCKELHMSKSNLNQKLKGITGLTPREFIENIRLKHAARMITDGVHQISEVAYTLGFSSPKYFTLRFKKVFGMSPKEYKESNK